MTDLTEQEVCIGSLGQQEVYINLSDVNSICTNDVSEDYEQTKRENQRLKELIKEYKEQLSEIKNAYIDLTTQDEYGSYYIDEAKLFVEIVGKTIKDYDEPKIDNTIGEKK